MSTSSGLSVSWLSSPGMGDNTAVLERPTVTAPRKPVRMALAAIAVGGLIALGGGMYVHGHGEQAPLIVHGVVAH